MFTQKFQSTNLSNPKKYILLTLIWLPKRIMDRGSHPIYLFRKQMNTLKNIKIVRKLSPAGFISSCILQCIDLYRLSTSTSHMRTRVC